MTKSFADLKNERKVLPTGMYVGTLMDVKPVEKEWEGEKKMAIRFEFYLAEKDTKLSRDCGWSFGKNSHLAPFVKSITGKAVPMEIFNHGTTFEEYITPYIGKEYDLFAEQNQAGTFTNVKSAVPKVKKSAKGKAPETLTDDEIPF